MISWQARTSVCTKPNKQLSAPRICWEETSVTMLATLITCPWPDLAAIQEQRPLREVEERNRVSLSNIKVKFSNNWQSCLQSSKTKLFVNLRKITPLLEEKSLWQSVNSFLSVFGRRRLTVVTRMVERKKASTRMTIYIRKRLVLL